MKVTSLLFLLLIISCTTPIITFENGASFSVELAKTPQEHAKGLMNRTQLDDNAGMLFIFADQAPRTFWMKNTILSLDMIFLDQNMTIVEIKKGVQPCASDPCPTYPSLPAQYVLELNAGTAARTKIVVGMNATSKIQKTDWNYRK
ncbi:MAG TPA: DUF192 domain-containing protein [Candidatus Nanoarchaeia archaeon]|nr:DUF192 domain-containing protein [Candidatus Nanoarchaeia archaeon]